MRTSAVLRMVMNVSAWHASLGVQSSTDDESGDDDAPEDGRLEQLGD